MISSRQCRCYSAEAGNHSLYRGAVTILNRKTLEAFACECYAVIRQYNGTLR